MFIPFHMMCVTSFASEPRQAMPSRMVHNSVLLQHLISLGAVNAMTYHSAFEAAVNGLLATTLLMRSDSILVRSISSGVVMFSASKWSLIPCSAIFEMPVRSLMKSIGNKRTVILAAPPAPLPSFRRHAYFGSSSTVIVST